MRSKEAEVVSQWAKAHPEKNRRRSMNSYDACRRRAFEVLGDRCAISGCENQNLEFHHKNGDGAEHRKAIWGVPRGRAQLYWVLKHPVEARESLDLLCRKHHKEADRKLKQTM